VAAAVLVGTRKGLFVLTSDETDRAEVDDLETPLGQDAEVRLVAAVAGG
jgi:hypothetical protein